MRPYESAVEYKIRRCTYLYARWLRLHNRERARQHNEHDALQLYPGTGAAALDNGLGRTYSIPGRFFFWSSPLARDVGTVKPADCGLVHAVSAGESALGQQGRCVVCTQASAGA